jgi:hypothetical protein
MMLGLVPKRTGILWDLRRVEPTVCHLCPRPTIEAMDKEVEKASPQINCLGFPNPLQNLVRGLKVVRKIGLWELGHPPAIQVPMDHELKSITQNDKQTHPSMELPWFECKST